MSISKRTRENVYVNAEGRSQASGTPLGADWEVDHRQARAAGGSDDITNLRAVSRAENRVKSDATPPPLRAWQRAFRQEWDLSTSSSFLLVALPGTGKTIAALTVADEWIREAPQRRKVLIVVPTDPLRTQWQHEASRVFGLNLQTREFTGWKPEMVGAIVTYQGLVNSAQLWKLRCSEWDVLALCDEVHHTGDENQWGEAIKEALHLAKRRLLTSGTPFRGDSTRIPFVNYDGQGQCIATPPHGFRYDYPEALRDGVIRVVSFRHEHGVVRHLTSSGAIVQSELSSQVAIEDANERLRRILTPGGYTDTILRLAHERLLEVRARGMTTAGALAICLDQMHAQQIAQQLERIIGHAPDIVVSDEERATSTVQAFRDSNRPWVVAVKKISEGVDIKRLMVLAYLTDCKTPLFFQQAVGRIVRNLGTEYDAEAYCFIPDHPLLVEHAQHITDAQYHAIVNDDDDNERRQRQTSERQPPLFAAWADVLLGTEHTGSGGTIIDGHTINPIDAARVTALAREFKCAESIVAGILRRVTEDAHSDASQASPRASKQTPLEDQLDDARRALGKVISRRAYELLPDDDERFPKIQYAVKRHIGKRRDQFTLDDCARAIQFVTSDDVRRALERKP